MRPDHEAFIRKQHVFFVASAPLSGGHVNLSPKGYDSFTILSPTEVCYLDLTGSGNETSAHLRENGRITFMFCAFEGPPLILRLYGAGKTVLPGSADWDRLAERFALQPGTRQLIHVHLDKVQTSCGYGVPVFDYSGDRDTLHLWADRKGDEGLSAYHREKNVRTIDGLLTPIGESLQVRS